jgi:hypothetical protein
MTLSRIFISYMHALLHLKWGVATRALLDFISSKPNRIPLKKDERMFLKPFFYQNSFFHRIFVELKKYNAP